MSKNSTEKSSKDEGNEDDSARRFHSNSLKMKKIISGLNEVAADTASCSINEEDNQWVE